MSLYKQVIRQEYKAVWFQKCTQRTCHTPTDEENASTLIHYNIKRQNKESQGSMFTFIIFSTKSIEYGGAMQYDIASTRSRNCQMDILSKYLYNTI